MWSFMEKIPDIALAIDPKNTKAKALKAAFKTAGAVTDALKSSSIGDVTKKDPLSFNEDLKINTGIDYEKFNFDKALSDKGMKPFSTGIKNSDDIFTWKTDTPMSGLGINYDDDDYPKFKPLNIDYTNF